MSIKILDKAIDQKLLEVFQSHGLEKKGKAVFHTILEEGKECEVIIEKTDRRTRNTFYLNPVINFIHNNIETLSKELAPDFYSPNTIVSTLFEPLGYLLPENIYKTYDFHISYNDKQVVNKVQYLVKDIEKYAIPKMKELCNDEFLLHTLKSHLLGIQITNRIKAPVLLCLLNRKEEAVELATDYLKEIRPTQKDLTVHEPEEFPSVEDAFSFFKRDEDPRYYFFYKKYYNRLKLQCRK